jgi:PIN domain nuclease of toxin-antitoxin system
VTLLIDSHVLLWAVDQPARLSAKAETAIKDPAQMLAVSAATVWEIAIKVGLRKLSLSLPYQQWMTRALSDLQATILPITIESAGVQAALPYHHGDPFDRMLIAQAQVEQIPIVSHDPAFDNYGVMRIW